MRIFDLVQFLASRYFFLEYYPMFNFYLKKKDRILHISGFLFSGAVPHDFFAEKRYLRLAVLYSLEELFRESIIIQRVSSAISKRLVSVCFTEEKVGC